LLSGAFSSRATAVADSGRRARQQTREGMAHKLAERWCGQAAGRDGTRRARRLYRTPGVDGGSQLDDGALLDDGGDCLEPLGVSAWRGDVQGTAVQCERGPMRQSLRRDRLKTLLGIERRQALPALLGRAEARMRVGGCKARQVRPGVCQRGAAQRPGPRPSGPMGPEALADQLVQLNGRALETVCNDGSRARAKAGGGATTVPGSIAATALDTTAPSAGGGHGTGTRTSRDPGGHAPAIAGPVYGWKRLGWIDAGTKLPLAAQVGPLHAHDGRSRRAWVPQARPHLAGHARLQKVGCARGVWDGVDRGWLEPRGILVVGPATDTMAVTSDARAPAASGEGITGGRRVHPARQGPGQAAWPARLETAVVGRRELTPEEPYGTPDHGRHQNRRDCQPTPIHAVVVRQGHGRDDGPRGNPCA